MQHVACETPGTIADALARAGLSTSMIRSFDGQPVPGALGEARALVVMGGPMGVYEADRHPFLSDEMRLIEEAVRRGVPVLGVCLGSQMIASVLGATVAPAGFKEIGWRDVTLGQEAAGDPLWRAIEPRFPALHWHGDAFDLPEGAVPLASSDATPLQAFRYGEHVYATLFHIEVTTEIVRGMVATFADELDQERIDARALLEETEQRLPAVRALGNTIFDRWASIISR